MNLKEIMLKENKPITKEYIVHDFMCLAFMKSLDSEYWRAD